MHLRHAYTGMFLAKSFLNYLKLHWSLDRPIIAQAASVHERDGYGLSRTNFVLSDVLVPLELVPCTATALKTASTLFAAKVTRNQISREYYLSFFCGHNQQITRQ